MQIFDISLHIFLIIIEFVNVLIRSEGNNGSVPTVSIPQVHFDRNTDVIDSQPFVEHSNSSNNSSHHCKDHSAESVKGSEEDLIKVLRILLEKEDQQNKDDQIRREWRLLAEIIDKWLFWAFFIITTLSTAIFIVILPYGKRGKFFWKRTTNYCELFETTFRSNLSFKGFPAVYRITAYRYTVKKDRTLRFFDEKTVLNTGIPVHTGIQGIRFCYTVGNPSHLSHLHIKYIYLKIIFTMTRIQYCLMQFICID